MSDVMDYKKPDDSLWRGGCALFVLLVISPLRAAEEDVVSVFHKLSETGRDFQEFLRGAGRCLLAHGFPGKRPRVPVTLRRVRHDRLR